MAAPIPSNESSRQAALDAYGILDTDPEAAFDQLTAVAAQIFDAPIALVSLIDRDRQWFKSHLGVNVRETSRTLAFCAHAVFDGRTLVVHDASQDPRFADNELVTGEPGIRFYAGAPLVTPLGYRLGTLCVIDPVPREPTSQQLESLEHLADHVVSQLELRNSLLLLGEANAELNRVQQSVEQSNLQLTQTNAELEQFAYIAAHDLKAPLRCITNLATWIRDDLVAAKLPIPLDVDRYLNLIGTQTSKMDELLRAVLDYARAGVDPRTEAETCIKTLIGHVIETVLVDSRFRVLLSGEFPVVRTDPRALERVLTNLIVNAIKHHDRETGAITVTCSTSDAGLEFEVADDGPGIPERQVERACQMFQRLRPDDGTEGSGVGLAIVKRLVNARGGELTIAPNETRGTRIRFLWCDGECDSVTSSVTAAA